MNRSLLLGFALAGCITDLGPEVGGPIRPTCIDVDSDPRVDVSFGKDILASLIDGTAGRCADCHTPLGKTPFGLENTGLDLTSYQTLVAGGTRSAGTIVIAGKPCESVLLQKIGPSPPFGARMPLDGPPFLSDVELQRIADWIAEGAHDN